MKRSVGAFFSCASSTSRTTRAIVLSSAAAVTRMRKAASPLIVPANTCSPSLLETGVLSPVTGASSIALVPATTMPSAEIRSPGRTRMTEPTVRFSAGTSRVLPPSSSKAVFGTNAVRLWMLERALPAATPSRSSPTRNRKTTAAASSDASMITAPTAAIVISISIENGVPAKAAMIARRAIGTRPNSIAAVKI
ncbi:hypothetical protein D3C73_1041040 [compost metagenome]